MLRNRGSVVTSHHSQLGFWITWLCLLVCCFGCSKITGSTPLPNGYTIEKGNSTCFAIVKHDSARKKYDTIAGPTISCYAVVGNIVVGLWEIQRGDPYADKTSSEYGYFVLNTATGKLQRGLTEVACVKVLSGEYGIQSLPRMVRLFEADGSGE